MEGGVTVLQYAGYDLHALVKRTGLLVPADATTGAVVSFSAGGLTSHQPITVSAAQLKPPLWPLCVSVTP